MSRSLLINNILVVTPDNGRGIEVIENAFVVVADGWIKYVGNDEVEARKFLPGEKYEIYDGKDRLILPAFANTHGHLPMTLFRNQADDRNLHEWLFDVIFPREAHLTEEIVARGTRLALVEMIRSGTGAAADMYYFHDSVAHAAWQSGFRLNFSCDAKSPDKNGRNLLQPEIIADARDRWENGLLKVSLLVHSVYLYQPEVYPELAGLALAENIPVQVHVSETRNEVEQCLARYGKRPPAQLAEFGFFQTPTIAAHCVHLNEDDRRILAGSQITVAHNPASNLKLGSGIADIRSLFQDDVRVSIGTDGAASNNNLDMYREMRMASLLAKGSSGAADALPAGDVLRMATINGMQAMGFESSGRIDEGCQADFQILNLRSPELTPLGNPVSALVYSCGRGAVESLMVAGKWLMKYRELTTIDEERVLFEAREAADWINGI